MTYGPDQTGRWRYVVWGHYWGNGGLDATAHVDDIFIQKGSQARVEVGNAATFAACTHREIQIPTSWAAEEVVFDFNIGSLADGSTGYVYVVDSTGAVNSAGFPIGVGEDTVDTTAPTITGAVMAADGNSITITGSEILVTTGSDDGDFNIDATAAGDNIALNSMTGSGATRTLTTASTIPYGDTCNLDYTGGANEIEDAAGNDLGGTLTNITVTWATPTDTTGPVLSNGYPSGELECSAASQNITIGFTSDEDCTCRYGANAAAWADMSVMSSTGETTHIHQILGIVCDSTNTYDILCRDRYGNESAALSIDFTVEDAEPADTTAPIVVISTAAHTVSGSTTSIAATAADNVTLLNDLVFRWTLTEPTAYTDGTAFTGGTASITGLAEGENTVYIIAVDEADNYRYSFVTVYSQATPRGWYLDCDVATTGNGGSSSPFKTHTELEESGVRNIDSVYIRGDCSAVTLPLSLPTGTKVYVTKGASLGGVEAKATNVMILR